MPTITDFDQARDLVKECLEPYLSSLGLKGKFFLCPFHNDRNPSCHIIPGRSLVHCFSCGVTADVFEIAAAKEGKPLSGKGFVTDNLMYLANRFGVALPDINLTSDELYELEMRRAYVQAARIIQSSEVSKQVSAKLREYMWPTEVIQKIGIGSVKSYEDYIIRMTKNYKLQFLTDIDLANKFIFRPNNLIYTIRDAAGTPIAFSARNLDYEKEMAEYGVKCSLIRALDISQDEKKDRISNLWRPHKYVNTRTTRIFEKRRTLFNFNEAIKSANKQLVVFEGGADCVTVFAGGVLSAVACCGTAFTKEHLEMAVAAGIKKIILVFDPDAAGEAATKRFISILTEYGDRPELGVSMILMPKDTGDPDAYVRSFGNLRKGTEEFRKLPQTDLFSWRILQMIEEGGDRTLICHEAIPTIVSTQPSNLRRLEMADRLSVVTGVDREFVRREVLRLIDEVPE